MHILVISCVYPPEPVVSARTSAQLANELSCQGHHVTVIAPFPNRPSGKIFPGYERKLVWHQKMKDEFDIIRCFSSLSPKSTIISRLIENISFGVMSAICTFFQPNIDVIYANTWPIGASGILVLVSKLRDIPLVLSIQDLYPESLAVQGRLTPRSPFWRLLQKIDRWIASQSKAVIVISDRFEKIYLSNRKIPARMVYKIPNWSTMDDLQSAPPENLSRIRSSHNIPEDCLLFVYGGNIGRAAGMETLLRAFQRAAVQCPQIILLIAGEGSELAACREFVTKSNIQRVKFHTPWKVEDTFAVLQAADVLLLPTQSDQSMVSMPSKLISYLLAGRPILAQAHPKSDLAAEIIASESGWTIPPGNERVFGDQMVMISKMSKEDFEKHGVNARLYAERNYSKEQNLAKLTKVILNSVK